MGRQGPRERVRCGSKTSCITAAFPHRRLQETEPNREVLFAWKMSPHYMAALPRAGGTGSGGPKAQQVTQVRAGRGPGGLGHRPAPGLAVDSVEMNPCRPSSWKTLLLCFQLPKTLHEADWEAQPRDRGQKHPLQPGAGRLAGGGGEGELGDAPHLIGPGSPPAGDHHSMVQPGAWTAHSPILLLRPSWRDASL